MFRKSSKELAVALTGCGHSSWAHDQLLLYAWVVCQFSLCEGSVSRVSDVFTHFFHTQPLLFFSPNVVSCRVTVIMLLVLVMWVYHSNFLCLMFIISYSNRPVSCLMVPHTVSFLILSDETLIASALLLKIFKKTQKGKCRR